jgi:hypothetical protein
VAAPGVLGNDTDANFDPLTATLVQNTQRGVLTLASDGSFTWTPPNTSMVGMTTAVYRANDGTFQQQPAAIR